MKKQHNVELTDRYRCHYCGSTLFANKNSRGFWSIICTDCGPLLSSYTEDLDHVIEYGLNTSGAIYDLDAIHFDGSYLQMSQVPEEY